MTDDPSSRSWISRLFSRSTDLNGHSAALPETETATSVEGENLLVNVRDFHDKRVDDVMVPRADIVAIEIDTPLGELMRLFDEASHSRLPVYRESLDDPVGVAHIKDVIGYMARYATAENEDTLAELGEEKILGRIRRPLLYVPASMRAMDLLLKMQSRRQHMALVVDEFGGTDGLVTLEDLIEPIVGDIEDEHDDAETRSIVVKGPDCWEADARAEIEDLEDIIGNEIATEEEEADVDTLGGLVFRLAGRVPERGEVLAHPSGIEFEVLDSDPRRIKRVRVRPTVNAPDNFGSTKEA
jgi:CBS domain containing-hemolysin-like protein